MPSGRARLADSASSRVPSPHRTRCVLPKATVAKGGDLITARALTSSTSGGGGSSLPGFYDVTASPYNASTGATDNTAAIQAAINAAKTNGGTVYVPPGVFQFASPLICDLPTKGFSIQGASGGAGHGVLPSELRYTGTAGPAISCHSVYGFALQGLRFSYNNAGFTGDLIDLDGQPHAADCTNWRISDCTSKALGATLTARSIVRLHKAINGIIRDCGWGGAVNCIRMADPGTGYVVGVKVENCTFNASLDTHHILIGSNDAENITIDNCRFEAGTSTGAVRCATIARDGADGNMYCFEFSNNWCGDAAGAADWLKDLRPIFNGPVTVRANYFADTTGTHVGCDSAVSVILNLIGNYFEAGANVFKTDTSSMVSMIGNIVNNPVNICNDGGDGPFEWTAIGNRGASGATVEKIPWDRLPARIAIGTGKVSSAFPGSSLAAGLTGNQEQLVLGAYSAIGLVTLGKKAAIYTSLGNDSLTDVLNLQAPTDNVSRRVCIVAGTTPTVRLTANGTGLGFYTATPVAQAARAGQLTDGTGGTASSTLASGITDTVAKNAIASLAAKVNALETIIHNLGLSA